MRAISREEKRRRVRGLFYGTILLSALVPALLLLFAVVGRANVTGGWLLFHTAAAACAGAFLSLFILPLTTKLWRKDIRIALAIVFGAALLAPPVLAFVDAGPGALCFVMVLAADVAGFLVWLLLPDRYALAPESEPLCPTCNYDLRGGEERDCPECGWRREEVKS